MFKCDYNFCLFSLAILAILIYLIIDWYRKYNRLPPGPRGYPIIGYFPPLTKKLHLYLKDLSDKYGNLLSFRPFNGPLIVLISEFEIAKQIIVNRAEEFIGRPLEFNLINWVDGGLGVAQTESRVWKEQRRFFMQNAGNFGFGKMEIQGTILEMTEKLIEDVRKLNGKPFEPLIHISHVTCNVISEIIFKKKFNKNEEFKSMMTGLNDFVSFFTDYRMLFFDSFLRFMIKFTKTGRKAEKDRKYIVNLINNIVEDHVKTFNPQSVNNFVDSYLYHMKNLEEKGQLRDSSFSRERLNAVTLNMFMEGTESVSSAICGLLVELSQHVDVQKKVQEELDNEVGRNRLPSWQDRAKLMYFSAVIQELYRTKPPFQTSVYHSNYVETEINGYRIPKRSLILTNFYALHNDSQMYPEPSKFQPERFLDSSGKLIKQNGPFAFGLGKRACIGEPLAQMEVFLIIAALLQNFTIFTEEGEQLRAIVRD